MISVLAVIGILASAVHPHLYATPEDVSRARANVQRFAWAKRDLDEMRANADKWTAMSDAELRALVPPPNSTFAYGFSGCPECGANWPWWGASGLASFDRPGGVTCPKCKRTFPDSDHPDTGTGWHNPKDKKTYHFVAAYNSFAAIQITQSILKDLAFSYAITGDRKYSRAAASVFDRLADIYPTCTVGSVDYPNKANHGRLKDPMYQVARTLVLLANYLDLLYDSPDFAAPSASGKGSVREHVEEGVIRDGGNYCYDEVEKGYMGLTNGQADYVRGALAAGIMLNEKPWIDCGLSGPYSIYNFLGNCLDRDGHYYETSVGYGDHALSLYVDFAEMLCNYRTPEHPDGIDLYEHPKLQQALFGAYIDLDCFGHEPRVGDWGPDFKVVTVDQRYSFYPYIYSEVLCARARTDGARARWAAAREYISDGDVEARRTKKEQMQWRPWMMLHCDPVPDVKSNRSEVQPKPVLGGRGMAILRSGKGASGRAALIRYGPSHNHGHLDDLNLTFYGMGRDLTYDLGYTLGSAHVQTSWSRHSASHNVVVVNEKSQMVTPESGGSAHFYVDAAPVRAFEASDDTAYLSEKVSQYRRTLALVDIPGGSSYLLDIFRVTGGSRHDLMWHFYGEILGVEGAALGPAQETGSLAGPDIDWGRKVGPAGDLIGCGDKPPYWNAPPGNGYGFLYNVRRSEIMSNECGVTWKVSPKGRYKVALRLLPEPGCELVTARAPGILPEYATADYAILRRKGDDLKSTFVSLVEPIDGEGVVQTARRMDCSADASAQAVGVQVESSAGTDYVLSALTPTHAEFRTASGQRIEFSGRFGFMRVKDGKIKRAVLVGGTQLAFKNLEIASPTADYAGTITAIDCDRCEVKLDAPISSALAGSLIYFSRDGYTHNSPYTIAGVSEDGKSITLTADLVLGKGQLAKDGAIKGDALPNIVPLPKATDMWGRANGYFRGKLIRDDRTVKSTNIIDVEKDQRTIHVKDTSGFVPEDGFTIYDVQAGDRFYVPAIVLR